MAFRCPHCGRELDATLFEFGRKLKCECGRTIEAGHRLRLERPPEGPRPAKPKEAEGEE